MSSSRKTVAFQESMARIFHAKWRVAGTGAIVPDYVPRGTFSASPSFSASQPLAVSLASSRHRWTAILARRTRHRCVACTTGPFC